MSDSTHTESEDDPWVINIPDHPQRTDSQQFVHAKTVAHRILGTLTNFYGPGPWQMHHGGSLWVFDRTVGWQMFRNLAGIEWSAQFAADPVKVERLRVNAQLLTDRFPDTIPMLISLGYRDTDILKTPISTADDVARFVDSIWNSCVPLAAPVHTGTLKQTNYQFGGVHHYPTPITDVQFFKRDDFNFWVTDPQGATMAVVPASANMADRSVEVLYAEPGSVIRDSLVKAMLSGQRLLLHPDHPAAMAAFAPERK